MITKEQNINKYCCLYVSDFHLEMILLPFIKNKMDSSKILFFTQKNLYESVQKVLERTNLNLNNKNKILNIKNWNNKKIEIVSNEKDDEYTIIVNGDKEYRDKTISEIKRLKINVKSIVDCYDINNCGLKLNEIKNKYEGVLNTGNL